MDKHISKMINHITDHGITYFEDMIEKYDCESLQQYTRLTFYPYTYIDDKITEAILNISNIGGRPMMFVNSGVLINNDTEVIYGIESNIYMSYESLYELIITCRMNIDDILKSLEFMIRHEIGHVIADHNKFYGKSVEEWNEQNMNFYSSVKKIRKNASFKNRLEWYINYQMNIPEERAANDAVGITEQDVIDDFLRTHQP